MTKPVADTKKPRKTTPAAPDPDSLLLEAFRFALNAILDTTPGAPRLHHGRQKWLADICKVSTSATGKWISGEGMPGLPNMLLLADALNCSMDELLGRRPIAAKKTVSLPIHSDLEGKPSVFGAIEIEEGVLESAMKIHREGVELFYVPTDSMAPDINVGDIAFIDTQIRQIEDNGVYLFSVSANNRILIRRTHLGLDGTSVQLLSTNANYPAIPLSLSEIWCPDNPSPAPTLKLRGQISWVFKKLSGTAR